MGRFLCIGLIILADFAFANKEPLCESTPPLKLMYQVVPHFKEAQFCNRTCTTDYHVSDGGVRHISITCKLNECETASKYNLDTRCSLICISEIAHFQVNCVDVFTITSTKRIGWMVQLTNVLRKRTTPY